MTANQQAAHPRRRRVRVDIAIVIALAPVVIATLRIWMYSGGDNALFLVLLRTINIPAVLAGTTVRLLPGALVLALIVLVTDRKARSWAIAMIRSSPALSLTAAVALLVVTVYLVSWPTLALLAAVSLVAASCFFIRRAIQRRREHRCIIRPVKTRDVGPDSVATIVAVIAMFFILPSNFWLPLEQVDVETKAEVGYVLESDSQWTTVMTRNRELHILVTSDITSREICSVPNPGTLALAIQQGGLKAGADCG